MAKIYLARSDVAGGGEHTYFVFDPDGDPTTNDEKIIRGGPAGTPVIGDDRYLVEVDRDIGQSYDALNGDDPFEDRWYTTIHDGPLEEIQDLWDGAVERAKELGELGQDPRPVTHDPDTGEAPDAYFLPEDGYWLTGPNCNCVTNTVGQELGIDLGETLPRVGGDTGSGGEQIGSDLQNLGHDMIIGTTGDEVFDVDENNKKFFDQGGSDTYKIGPEDLDGFNAVRINEDSDVGTVDKIELWGYDPDEITLYRNPISGDMIIGTPDGLIIIEDQFSGDGVPGINILELDPPGDGPNLLIPLTNPDIFPTALPQPLPSVFDDFLDDWNDAENAATPTPISPLVLDLDGDGIELSSVLGSDSVYWDIDNDGFLEQSGFVTGDDGLLAIDLNGDGVINNHSELFGTETTDGFTVLSNYDSNSDGVIDSSDTQFSDLLVWIDANADGYSASDELYSLADLGITDIALNASLVDYEISGNQITHESTFTINGQTRTIVDAWFSYDNVNSVYAQDYTPDVRTLYLPTLRGFGDVKDLSIAMSEDETLLLMVQDIALTDKDELFTPAFDLSGKIDDVLFQWAGVEDVAPDSRGQWFDGQKLAFMEAYLGNSYVHNGNNTNPPPGAAGDILRDLYSDLKAVLVAHIVSQTDASEFFEEGAYYNANSGTIVGSDISALNLIDPAETYSNASDMGQTHVITPNNVSLTIDDAGGVDSVWLTGISQDDVRLEVSANQFDLYIHFGSETITLKNHLRSFYLENDSYDNAQIETLRFDDGTVVNLIESLTLNGTDGDDVIKGTKLDDALIGEAGNDTLIADNGDDTLTGGAGDDDLRGEQGNDTYIWNVGDGNDTISDTDGSDIIEFGTGISQSQLSFTKSGIDLKIAVGSEMITVNGYYSANTSLKVEELHFDDGSVVDLRVLLNNAPVATDESFTIDQDTAISGNVLHHNGNGADYDLDGDDLSVIAGTYTTAHGSVILSADGSFIYTPVNGYTGNDSFNYTLDDGFGGTDIGTVNIVINASVVGNAINGTSSSETLYGDQDGIADDIINGLEGNDALYGYGGSDVLTGGAGNDTLYGGNGDDQFIWSVGDGNDTINDDDGTDQLVMHGVSENDLRFEAHGFNLKIHAGSETITINTQIQSDAYGSSIYDIYRVDSLLLDDGTTIDLTGGLTFTGTSAGETVYGLYQQDDTLNGLEGNDYLYGYGGDDILTGGTGNDTLYGGNGDDQFIWSVGDGDDTINDDGGTDRIVMHGVSESDIRFEAHGFNLKIHAGSETITINTQIQSDAYGLSIYDIYRVDSLLLDDGTTIDLTGGLTFTGTSAGETVSGLYQQGDTLNGLEGNDYLYGYGGDDVLIGGAGNDTLIGGAGADTFVFDSSADVDTVQDFSLADGDKIDISDLISGYDPLTDAISDFVQITDSGSSSIVSVDADGGADNFVQIATLNNVTGLTDENALETSGNLIAA